MHGLTTNHLLFGATGIKPVKNKLRRIYLSVDPGRLSRDLHYDLSDKRLRAQTAEAFIVKRGHFEFDRSVTSNLTEEENAQNQRIKSAFPEIECLLGEYVGTKGSAYCLTRRPGEGLSLRGRATITRAHWRRLPLGEPRCRGEILLTSPRRAGTEKGEGGKLVWYHSEMWL